MHACCGTDAFLCSLCCPYNSEQKVLFLDVFQTAIREYRVIFRLHISLYIDNAKLFETPSSTVRPLLPRGGELQRAEERQARTLLQGEI